jgi:hypothetical protein
MPEEISKTDHEEIKVPILDMPSREEVRKIAKTGKGLDGTPVHPDTMKHLRKATIADLIAFGAEVNKANDNLNRKMNSIIDNMDLALKEVHWNFAAFMSFLDSEDIVKPGLVTRFEEHKKKLEDELSKAAEELFKKEQGEKADVPTEGESLEVPKEVESK